MIWAKWSMAGPEPKALTLTVLFLTKRKVQVRPTLLDLRRMSSLHREAQGQFSLTMIRCKVLLLLGAHLLNALPAQPHPSHSTPVAILTS